MTNPTSSASRPARRAAALILSGALAAAGLAATSAAPSGAAAPAQAGDFIVVLNDGANARGVAAEHARTHGVSARYVYEHAVTGYAAKMSEGQFGAVARDGRVKYIERDGVAKTQATQADPTWGLDRIDDRSGLDGSFSYVHTGAGVTAYIIDTGIDVGHEEFRNRLSADRFDAFTDGRNGDDCNGHGTHVAGTVGGATYGVAKGVGLVAVRVLDCDGSGSWSGVVAGIDWVVAHHEAGTVTAPTPAVANLSLGGGASTTVDNAVKRLIADGVATAVAAGNGNLAGVHQDACKSSPSRVPEAMTIGATTQADAKTSWSNYGKCVDWFAPGAGITSAWIGELAVEAHTISGTSMATPHTAGVAALYLQGNATATPQKVRDTLYAGTTKGVVTSSRTANNHLLFTAF